MTIGLLRLHRLNIPLVRPFRTSFGTEPVYKREGGGIPVATVFQTALDIPVVLMGFGLPDDNLHAPNEKMHLPNFYKGIQTSIVFMNELAKSTQPD